MKGIQKVKQTMILSLIVLLAGCGTWETRGTRVAVDTDSGKATVVEASYRLSNRVKVGRVTYDNTGDIRRATVTLTSLLKRRQRLQARMVWLDAEGTAIDADAKPFRALVLDGNDTTTFTGYAPSPKAVSAQLLVREMDTVE